MKQSIAQRLADLREEMKREHIDAFIFPSADAHNSEYTPEHWHGREWISGFNGSAGVAIVTTDKAALWTDSRYFIAAADALKGTEFELMKIGQPDTPSMTEWLGMALARIDGATVGIDGYCCTQSEAETLKDELRHEGGITLRTNLDILNVVWKDRPPMPADKVFIHPDEFNDLSCHEKLGAIRCELKAMHANGMLISALDEIAWTLNLRGNDVHCTPVFLAYLLLDGERTTLFIDPAKLTDEVKAYLSREGVSIDDYANISKALAKYNSYNILLDPDCTSHAIYNKVKCQEILNDESPVQALKAEKTDTEIECTRNAMTKDGVALVRLIIWMEKAIANGERLTEMDIDEKLTQLKREQPLFHSLSFDTIAAFGEHGAIVHYEATPETNAEIGPDGLLLLDCGSQYLDGTTDITRTFAIGNISDAERHVCTTVMKAHIRLASAKWIEGTCGSQLDILARGIVWDEGFHFGHGTGHGVGYFLCCHEGPQGIRMDYKPAPMVPGVITSNEPGIYLEGQFGCRIENLELVVPTGQSFQGKEFFRFETLTLCPFDKKILDIGMLTEQEIDWIDRYHQRVYRTLAPHLTAEEVQWLKNACSPLKG